MSPSVLFSTMTPVCFLCFAYFSISGSYFSPCVPVNLLLTSLFPTESLSTSACPTPSWVGGQPSSAWRRWAGSSVGNAIHNYHIVASLDTMLDTSPMSSRLILTSHLPAGHHLMGLWWLHNCPSEERVLWYKSPVILLMVLLIFLIFKCLPPPFFLLILHLSLSITDIFPRSQLSTV